MINGRYLQEALFRDCGKMHSQRQIHQGCIYINDQNAKKKKKKENLIKNC